MQREHPLSVVNRVTADIVTIFVAFVLVFVAYSSAADAGIIPRGVPDPAAYMRLVLLFEAISIVVFFRLNLYHPRESVLNLWEMSTALKAVIVSAAFFLALVFMLKLEGFSRVVVVGWIALTVVLVPLERRVLSGFLRRRRLSGTRGDPVLIVGGGETGQLLLKKIVDSPHLGLVVAGFLDDVLPVGTEIACTIDQSTGQRYVTSVLGGMSELERAVEKHSVREILIDLSSVGTEGMEQIVRLADQRGLRFGIVPRVAHFRADHLFPEDLGAIPLLRPFGHSERRLYLAVKRAVDLVGGAALLLLTVPAWIIAAVLIKVDSRGPVLFSHERVGLGGRVFNLHKFRTMHVDVDAYSLSPVRERDARITWAGRLLRRTGLDELPQLLNVLRGEMSLVGPRPEMPFIVGRYSDLERKRLQAKPGITGLWQLSPDRHAQIHENIEYDLYYVNRRSTVLDTVILMETLLFTLGLIFRRGRPAADVTAAPGPKSALPISSSREATVASAGPQVGPHPLAARSDSPSRVSAPEL